MTQLRDRQVERLSVKFTDAEKIQKGNEIAELINDVQELKDDIKSMKKGMEAQIAEKEARINKISEELRTGQEFKSVDCQWTYDWDIGKKYLIRLDVNETVKWEEITDGERQTKLELDNPPPEQTEEEQAAQTEADLSAAESEAGAEAAGQEQADAKAFEENQADEAAAFEAQQQADADAEAAGIADADAAAAEQE